MSHLHQNVGAGEARRTLEILTAFYQEEVAAVETFKKVFDSPRLQRHHELLTRCYASHRMRASALAERIDYLGGPVPQSLELLESFGTLLPQASGHVSEALTLALLEEAEERGLSHYRERLDALDPIDRQFVLERILPGQNLTHACLSHLRRSFMPS